MAKERGPVANLPPTQKRKPMVQNSILTKIEFLKGLKNASKWIDEAIDEKRLNDQVEGGNNEIKSMRNVRG